MKTLLYPALFIFSLLAGFVTCSSAQGDPLPQAWRDLQRGNTFGARTTFERTLQQTPSNEARWGVIVSNILYFRGSTRVHSQAMDAFTQSAKSAQQMIKSDPDDLRGYAGLAWSYYYGHKTKQADRAFAELLRREPDDIDALAARTWNALDSGKNKQAVDYARQTLQMDPRNRAAHLGKILALTRLKRFDEAFGACEDAIVTFSRWMDVDWIIQGGGRRFRIKDKVWIGEPTSAHPIRFFEFDHKQFSQQSAALGRFLHKRSPDLQSMLSMTGATVNSGSVSASQPFRSLRERYPNTPKYLLLTGLVRNVAHPAINDLNSYLKYRPDDPRAYIALAAMHMKMKQRGLAADYLEKAAKLSPENPALAAAAHTLESNNQEYVAQQFAYLANQEKKRAQVDQEINELVGLALASFMISAIFDDSGSAGSVSGYRGPDPCLSCGGLGRERSAGTEWRSCSRCGASGRIRGPNNTYRSCYTCGGMGGRSVFASNAPLCVSCGGSGRRR